MVVTRRSFLSVSLKTVAGLSLVQTLGCSRNIEKKLSGTEAGAVGALLPPDENGMMLPPGFSARVVARTGEQPSVNSTYRWHIAPDGGAVFSVEDGGWIYVSNCEGGKDKGGVGALRFGADGNVIDSYPILEGTTRNCAGGATPWSTWLSCEEFEQGMVWECDPLGKLAAVRRPALGVFAHEAAAVDVTNNYIYLTEDRPDSCLYRYVPQSVDDGVADLSSGTLEVAVLDSSSDIVDWVSVPDPSAAKMPTRHQVRSAKKFNGGEGAVFHEGVVSFTTKGDNRVWSYDTRSRKLSVVYDASTHQDPILTGLDNIAVMPGGELIIAEDGGDLQIVIITDENQLFPLVQLVGHDASEVTGPAFSPDGSRLYFSSQRGTVGESNGGITYEVTGQFQS